MLGMIKGNKMARWGEREQSGVVLEPRVCGREIWWAGRAKSLNVPTDACWEGANDEPAHVPP